MTTVVDIVKAAVEQAIGAAVAARKCEEEVEKAGQEAAEAAIKIAMEAAGAQAKGEAAGKCKEEVEEAVKLALMEVNKLFMDKKIQESIKAAIKGNAKVSDPKLHDTSEKGQEAWAAASKEMSPPAPACIQRDKTGETAQTHDAQEFHEIRQGNTASQNFQSAIGLLAVVRKMLKINR